MVKCSIIFSLCVLFSAIVQLYGFIFGSDVSEHKFILISYPIQFPHSKESSAMANCAASIGPTGPAGCHKRCSTRRLLTGSSAAKQPPPCMSPDLDPHAGQSPGLHSLCWVPPHCCSDGWSSGLQKGR